MLKIILNIILALVIATPSVAATKPVQKITATITRVIDGDTIEVTDKLQTVVKVRLYVCDAPEIERLKKDGTVSKQGQPLGKEAADFVETYKDKQATIEVVGLDVYKRTLGVVWVENHNICSELLTRGLAEIYDSRIKKQWKKEFTDAELQGRTAKVGIWNLPNYERPKDFRKRMKIR